MIVRKFITAPAELTAEKLETDEDISKWQNRVSEGKYTLIGYDEPEMDFLSEADQKRTVSILMSSNDEERIVAASGSWAIYNQVKQVYFLFDIYSEHLTSRDLPEIMTFPVVIPVLD